MSADDIVGGAYQVKSLVASGGMGTVYLVEHLQLKRRLALKTLKKDRINQSAWNSFVLEAKVLARLEHPNLVKVYDLGIINNRLPYYVMDYVAGGTLATQIKESGPLSLSKALCIFEQVAAGMAYAEDLGLVHRDIKPSNIMLVETSGKSPQVKIVDFGLAMQENGALSAGERERVCGSPPYMSPEQTRNEHLDIRSDIYSFGCTLFEALTGSPPFIGESILIVLSKHQLEAAPTLKEATLGGEFPAVMEGALAKMLAKDPAMRFQSFHEIAELLSKMRVLQEENRLSLVELNTRSDSNQAPALERNARAGSETQLRKSGPASSPLRIAAAAVALLAIAAAGAMALKFIGQTGNNQPRSLLAFTGSGRLQEGSVLPESVEEKQFIKERQKSQDPIQVLQAYYTQHEPFSLVQLEGKTWRRFNSPRIFNLGTFTAVNRSTVSGSVLLPEGKSYAGPGTIIFDPHSLLVYSPSKLVASHPELLKNLKPDSVWGLDLANNRALSNETLGEFTPLTGLKYLDISYTRAGDGAIEELNKFTALEGLAATHSELTGDGLVKFKSLLNLKTLKVGPIFQLSRLLEKLSQSRHITYLEIADEPVSQAELQQIAAIASLQHLYLNGALSHSKYLPSLRTLEQLETVELSKMKTYKYLAEDLKTLPALKRLIIHESDLSTDECAALQKELPNLKIELAPRVEQPEPKG
ncbi:MAG: serine/threonine-protein kinase [Candidatus Obscuribacter sp.]|nr:serine/threonine-protein kinase [Candidatus Obscuribacter sp.]